MTLIDLFVVDVEHSVAFYEALGFERRRQRGDWVQLARGGALLVVQGDTHAVAGGHYFSPYIDRRPRGVGVEVVVEVDDVDALHAAARERGIDIVKPLQLRPWAARDFRVADPDGYFIRFTSKLGVNDAA